MDTAATASALGDMSLSTIDEAMGGESKVLAAPSR
jgi:hypothetical protein